MKPFNQINLKILKEMKKIMIAFALLASVFACQKPIAVPDAQEATGLIELSIVRSDIDTKAAYTTVLDDEKAEKKVAVLVFNKATGRLEASKDIPTSASGCTFNVKTGEKIIYAVINGPSLANVTSEGELNTLVDDLSAGNIGTAGLTMIGKKEATVQVGTVATSVSIEVSRLVSRIVVKGITHDLPAQYNSIRLESVFLANAYSKSTLGGTTFDMVNINGYQDAGKNQAIGKGGTQGLCSAYMFKTIGKDIIKGAQDDTHYILYAQPNDTDTYTKLMLYISYGGDLSGYYPIILDKKLKANTTYTVSLVLKNTPVPDPDDVFQTGSASVTITVKDWQTGDEYTSSL